MHDYGSIDQLTDELATERDFTIAFRGYDRREVDRCIAFLEYQHAALSEAHEVARAEVHELTAQLHRVHMRLLERSQEPMPGQATLGHLGERATRMLSLAEEEARELRENALADAQAQHERARLEVDQILADADRRRQAAVERFESDLQRQRDEHARESAGLLEQANATAAQVRADAAQARAEAHRYAATTRADAAKLRKSVEGEAAKLRKLAETEAARTKASAERYLRQAQQESRASQHPADAR